MERRRLGLAFVGGGELSAIGKTHRLAQRLSERFDLVAGAFDVDAERGRRYATSHFVPTDRIYPTIDDLIRSERGRPDPVDLVAVLTPNNTHFKLAMSLVQAGFHVLCEKPMTNLVGEAEQLEREVTARNLVFGVMYGFSGYPMIHRAREIVQSGGIGRVRNIQSEFAFGLPVNLTEDPHGHWRTKKGVAGDSAVVGMVGTHLVYLAKLITGLDVEEVAADFQSFVPGRELEDNANVLIRYVGGATGVMWNSYIAAGMDNGLRIRIYGETGGIEWDHENPNQLKHFRPGEPRQTITQPGRISIAAAPEGFVEAFANIYRRVADAIEAKKSGDEDSSRYPSVVDGCDGVRFVAAAVESSQRNSGWVRVRQA